MVALPDTRTETETIRRIYALYEAENRRRRYYLGASIIGHECRRYLWLLFRWAGRPTFPGRILRLFETGDMEEDRIIANLRAIGVRVEGEQHEILAVDGHVRGHFDGVVLGLPEAPKTWHLLEIKTANKKRFDQLLREGLKEWNPTYYTQMQIYMKIGGLTRGVFIVVCKDDDRIYMERIYPDHKRVDAELTKACAVIYADDAPERIGNRSSFYKCKWCNLSRLCWERVYPDVNCRTCAHGRVVPGGWECGRGFEIADQSGCSEHIYLPSLLHWLEPVAGSQERIEYNDRQTGEVVINAAGAFFVASGFEGGEKTSRELWKSTGGGE